jgi:hypothetical protein
LINEPGFAHFMDCNLCKCVKTPWVYGNSSSSSS